MNEASFTITGIVEGPVTGRNNQNVRLVCRTDSGKKIAFWGSYPGKTRNVDTIAGSQLPVRIRCGWIEPAEWARKYGHEIWVPESAPLELLDS